MKNKSGRHKEANTFTFQPFAERISNIDVDIFHRIGHKYEETDDEVSCYFRQTLVKWGTLNLTNGFIKFRKEVSGVVSLAQLLHDKDRIVESLLTNISYKDPLYLQPLLELVISLAKDLRKEFYPYYIKFLNQLIDVLNTKDTDILEWTFQCLAYIFKFLWRYLIKDIHNILSSLIPLLDNSKPDYVNNFAAESFAFVARKVHDRKLFLISILKLLKHKPEAIPGCGRLLFEVINGVQGQFHNCAEEILPFYFQSFSEEKCSQKVLFKLLEQVIFNITEFINPKKISLYWTSVLNVLNQFHDQWTNGNKSERIVSNIELLLTLIGQSIEYKEGKMLTNSEFLVDRLINLLKDNISDGISTKIAQIGALLLLYTQISLSQENTSRLTNRILLIPSKPTVMEFIKNVISCSSFEALILPTFLEYCVVEKLNQQVLHILTRIILQKSPIRLNGFTEWKPYVIDFPVSKQIAFEYDTSQILIDLLDINLLPEKLDDVICALVCIPHVKNVDKSKCAEKLFTMVTNLCNKINGNNLNRNELIELFFTLLICVDTLRNVSDKMDNCLNIILKTVTPYVSDYKFLSALRILDIVLSGCNDKLITNELLSKINEILIPNVSSQFHEVRLLTTHIFSLFENLQELNSIKTENNDTWKIFSICFDVESIEPNVSSYREQLKNLSHLNFDKPQATLYKDTDFKTYPLRYLLGVLYMNFKLLWKPTIEIISSQANGMPLFDDFWQVFFNQLHVALNNIENLSDVATMANSNITCDFVSDLYTKIYVINDKPDYHNYRLLLWNCMGEFPDLAHTKNRDVTTLFINFVNNEYLLSNSELAKSWNIQKHEINANLESTMNEDENEENAGEVELDTTVKFSRKATKSTLLAQLEVFSKMHNPKNMHREPELYQIYLELLMNRNSDIQKAALDCIMTYKHKYLTPYKEHLYNLINEKQLKNELALFRIDTDSEVLIKDHRKDFIPIVLRIVYSKMITKTGLRTGGKGGGQLKRSLILRFLSGCHEDELMLFVQMAFKYYSPFLRDNCDQIIADIDKNLDLHHTIAPKKLLSTINLLGIILEKFGAAGSKQLLPYLLRILLCVGGLLKSMFSRQEQIHVGYFNSLRQLRSSSIQIITRFFEHFEMYPWTKLEIDAVFDVFVWPWLDKLQIEGIHSPTALMKLFMCWSQNPRYFILLAKQLPDKPEQYAIPHILKLFLNPKTHLSVINAIVEILEHLLTLQPSEEEMASPQIPVDCYVKANKEILDRLKLKERLNFGSIIILTHVPSILQYLQNKIEKQKNFHKKELVILSRVSELVWEVETSDNLLKILLPILVKKASNASEDTVIQMVTTLCNLIQNVPNPIRHLKAVAPLFGEISTVPPRKLLCEFLQDLTQNSSDESIAKAKVVVELNAWDAKWIDQPDFTRRINAFRNISSLIDENDLEYEFGVIIIHNCFYLIKYENDISLRDNASDCLKKLSLYLATKYKSSQQTEFVINDTILSLIRNGIRDKNDKVRSESISLLGYIARECPPQTYNVLTDLAILTNKADLEVDFFENLQHLQLHRHVRALLKFSKIAITLTKPFSSRTLTQFVLPLITQYLCCDKYLQKNTIVDAAIEAVGSVCRMLPWHQYETILRYYLGKLRNKIEYQKQLVRIIVAILDAFHFDLSRAKDIPKIENVEISKNTEENEKEEIEMEDKKEIGEEEKEEQLEELLQAEASEDHEIVEEVHEKELTVFEKQTILAPSAARRLIYSITTGLLPQLNRAISQMKQSEHSHKLNKKRTGAEKEEDDILRVPIALAVVKLLQKLPENLLEQNLQGIFMKICTFLKSHLESVRRITREILEKIMTSLGPQHLNTLLNVITPLMNRGFQVHVLVYTVHGVLNSLKPFYKPGDLDKCLKTVLDLCIGDIFGIVAEEKEVDNIVNKTSEAKSTKSYDTFQILAQFITKTHLTELILPLKDILSTSFTYKKVRKAEECLRRIALGVIDNKFIIAEELLQFSFDVTSESIPELKCVEKPTLSKKEKELQTRQKPDCFIIPLAPKSRLGEVRNLVKQSVNSNAHVLIEFGLQLCYFLLKRDRLKELDYRQRMDPFVILMLNSLKSKHVKLSTLTLNCLCWVFKMDLPALKNNVKEFAKEIFNLLHKYAVAGLSKGDNFDLVLIAFKAMGVLVRDVKYFILNVDQLKTLLLYTEQDLHDHDRQATAFSLLKAIISRKFIAPEIHDVMQKLAKISIISEMDHVRQQARNVFHQFLMDYPLGNKLEKYITFYLSQLNYELDFGRQSALDMILSLIQSFPLEVLNAQSPVFFVTLGARLINDTSPECKKATAHCIKTMLERLERKERDILMDVILTWFQDEEQISHRQLAAQLCGLMVTVEKSNFESRLDNLIPILLLQFAPGLRLNEPGRFVRVRYENDTNFADEDIQRMRDHHLFQVLQLLLKLCVSCPTFLSRTEQIEEIAKYAQSFLGYDHQWVRLAAAQFIGFVMTVLKTEHIAKLYLKNKSEPGYLSSMPREDIKSLTLDLCAQLQVDNVNEQIVEQAVKNLIFIARILKELPLTKDSMKYEDDEDENENENITSNQRINLMWLVRRMRKVVFAEISQTPTVNTLRQAVFRWIGGLTRMLTAYQITPILHHLLAPLVRELATEEASADIKLLAKEVSNELKRIVGSNVYTETILKVQMKLNIKRAERKRERLQMAITDPERVAKKKIKFQAKKRELKKRKLAEMRGKQYIKTKKRKVIDLEEA